MKGTTDEAPRVYEKRIGDRVVVTLNSVYVLRDEVCVAARSRSSGIEEWDPQHRAIGLVSQGGWSFRNRGGLEVHTEVQPGDQLYLAGDSAETTLLTSEVVVTATVAKSPRQDPSEFKI